MVSTKKIQDGRKELLRAFTQLKTSKDAERFLEDILTPQELNAVVERWMLIKLLIEGKTQREVRDELGIAIATVTRGARQLKYGTGGFKMALNRITKSR